MYYICKGSSTKFDTKGSFTLGIGYKNEWGLILHQSGSKKQYIGD